MIYQSKESEQLAAVRTAQLMMAAARTAPKGCGVDNIEAMILDGQEKDALAEEMRKIALEIGADFYRRDAANVDRAHCIVMIGVKNNPIGLENCGNCGFGDCTGAAAAGANCAFNVTDLGIAVGSAASVAMDHRLDNRVLFSAGKAALRMGLFSGRVRVCYGIGLAADGKNIFFDRG